MEKMIQMLSTNAAALSVFAICLWFISIRFRKDCDLMKNIAILHWMSKIIFILDCAIIVLRMVAFETINTIDILLVVFWGIAIIVGCWAKFHITNK